METSLHKHFASLNAPRIRRNKKHLLSDIAILTIIAVICGAESWDSIELFGKTKIDFLKAILRLPNGIPSHDTINRVFSLLNPTKFERLFFQWAASLKDKGIDAEVISIDGKTVRGSKDTFHDQAPIHLVNAWAGHNELILGQCKSDGKSNEITTIPLLLELLDVERCIRDKSENETRYYISSLKTTAENFNEYIRMHWGVENKPHWTLGMTFNEDRQRKRNKMAAQNLMRI